MEREKAAARLAEAARKDTFEALRLLSWIKGNASVVERGLETGESLGRYNDDLRYMRSYMERLTRLSIQSYGCEEAIKALNEISENDKEENK